MGVFVAEVNDFFDADLNDQFRAFVAGEDNGQRGAFGQANYAAAKAGVVGFTRTLALELARKNVTVNTVSPGYLRTKMVEKVSPQVLQEHVLPEIPLGRLGDPDEVAQLVAYLCSEAGAFVTGANLAINGGQHMA